MSQNQYRNRLRTPWLTRIIFCCVTAAAVAATFAVLRNRHIKQGDRIHEAEMEIVLLDKEIEMWELRIAGQMDRTELARRLKWVRSDLKDITASQVLHLSTSEEVPALPKVATR
ncbi:MAG: hypothetical protein ACC661_12590 [Verrucomicrobiales bacterium]